jgi:hypothetical protein
MSALEKALKEFRDRQASLAASQVKDAATKVRPSLTPTQDHSTCSGNTLCRLLVLLPSCAKPLSFSESTSVLAKPLSFRRATKQRGAAAAQKKPAAKREPKAGRGRGRGRGRGAAAAAEPAAADKGWQTARLTKSGVPLSKQLKVGRPRPPETQQVVPRVEALRAGPHWSRSLGAHRAIEPSLFLQRK